MFSIITSVDFVILAIWCSALIKNNFMLVCQFTLPYRKLIKLVFQSETKVLESEANYVDMSVCNCLYTSRKRIMLVFQSKTEVLESEANYYVGMSVWNRSSLLGSELCWCSSLKLKSSNRKWFMFVCQSESKVLFSISPPSFESFVNTTTC